MILIIIWQHYILPTKKTTVDQTQISPGQLIVVNIFSLTELYIYIYIYIYMQQLVHVKLWVNYRFVEYCIIHTVFIQTTCKNIVFIVLCVYKRLYAWQTILRNRKNRLMNECIVSQWNLKLQRSPVCGAPWTRRQYPCPLQDWARTPARYCGTKIDVNKNLHTYITPCLIS